MVKQNGVTKNSRLLFAVWHTKTPLGGLNISAVSNMHIIPTPQHLQVYHPLKHPNPPLFLMVESECFVPSVQHHLCRCRWIWRQTKEALQKTAVQNKKVADQDRTQMPKYKIGQKVWLPTKDIQLKDTCKKLAPCFIGPFPIKRVINPA